MRGFGSVSPLGVDNNIACSGTSFAFCVLGPVTDASPGASFRASLLYTGAASSPAIAFVATTAPPIAL